MPTTETNELPLAVCAAVIEHRGKILLTQRPADKPHGGYWEFPGGKIEAGESPHQTLRRELREELDITISVGPLLKTVYHHYNWGCVLIITYRCRWQTGTIKHLEVADHAWVVPAQFGDYRILPADRPILEQLKKHSPPPSDQC